MDVHVHLVLRIHPHTAYMVQPAFLVIFNSSTVNKTHNYGRIQGVLQNVECM